MTSEKAARTDKQVRLGAAYVIAVLRGDRAAQRSCASDVEELADLIYSLVMFAASMAGTAFGVDDGDPERVARGIELALQKTGDEWE